MSVYMLSAVWEQADASGGELLVLLALADQARHDGTCRPSIARIAQMARMTERGAQKIIRRLAERGLVSVTFEKGGRGHTNEYCLHVNPEQKTPNAVQGITPKPRTEVHETPNGGSPDPLGPEEGGGGARAREASEIDEVVDAAQADVSKPGWYDFNVSAALRRWRELGLSLAEITGLVAQATASKRDGPANSPAYFDRLMAKAAGEKRRPALTPIDTPAPKQRRSNPNDRLARLVNRLAPDPGGRSESGAEMADRSGDDLPQPLLPARSRGG